MAVKILMLGLCLVGSLQAAPQEPLRCPSVCASEFHGPELEGCQTGCHLMDIEETLNMGNKDLEDVKKSCQASCQSSYGVKEDVAQACVKGCDFMAPFVKDRHQMMRNPFASLFGNDRLLNQVHLPQIFPFSGPKGSPQSSREVKDSEEKKNPLEGMFGNFGNVISNMHRVMDSMMQKFRNGELLGNGKLVVIKARPGHVETETYDLSPQNSGLGNDMMNKVNPLDDFFNAKFKEDKKDKDEDDDVYGVEFVKPVESNSNLEKEDENWVMEPILPETGLKSRIVHEDNICNRHPEYMSWSNYFYCVDRRITTSGWWVYVCILPLACLLLLRVCMLMAKREADTLVPLPTMMTSHKDVLAKAKEAEANASVISIVTIPDYQKNDLPPAYEDVTNLKVSLVPSNKENQGSSNKDVDEHKNEAHA